MSAIRFTSRLVVLFLPLLLLAGCRSKNSTSPQQTESPGDSLGYIRISDAPKFLPGWSKENVIVYHTIAEPDQLHPTNATSSMAMDIFQYTQMSLIRIDMRTLDITPALLARLPELNPGGLSYDCELRRGCSWDDGTPITASDVVFTAMISKCMLTDNPHAKPYWDNLKSVTPDPEDPLRFRVEMKAPYMYNLIFWTGCSILQHRFFDPEDILGKFSFDQFNDSTFDAAKFPELTEFANRFNDGRYGRDIAYLNGPGMYKVKAWDPGQSVTLSRKENHWTANSTSIYETSYPDKIIYRVNKDPNSQMLELKSQVLDGSNLLPAKLLMELQTDSNFNRNYHSRFTDTFNYTYIGMNTLADGSTHKKLFTDKKVRRAMAHLTPVDEINRVIYRGINRRMIGPVSFLKKDFDTTLKAIPFDLEKASALLKEAGWQDSDGDQVLDKVIDGVKISFEFRINYMTNTPEWKDFATIISEYYAKAGIRADLNPLDYPVFVEKNRKHDFDMIIGSWGQSALPEDFSQLWHTSAWKNEGANYTGFGNETSDALIDSIKTIIDPITRRPLVHRFQQMVYDEQPMIFLFSSVRRNVIHKRFGNVEMYFERPGILLNNLRLLSTIEVIN